MYMNKIDVTLKCCTHTHTYPHTHTCVPDYRFFPVHLFHIMILFELSTHTFFSLLSFLLYFSRTQTHTNTHTLIITLGKSDNTNRKEREAT